MEQQIENTNKGENQGSIFQEFLQKVPSVDIDADGVFKYVLIKAEQEDQDDVYFVRGYKSCDYHADVFEIFINNLEKNKYFDEIEDFEAYYIAKKGNQEIKFICTGGGRIQHNSQQQKILVYGYSMGFGLAKHSITQEYLKKHYNQYPSENITWNNEGY